MMKKFLLSLIALLGVVSANAQVTKTDVSGYSYVIYAEDITALPGTTVTLPIYLKNAATVQSFQCSIVLPEGVSFVKTLELDETRYDKSSDSYMGNVFGGNPQDDGSTMILGTVLEDNGFNVGDAHIGYVSISIAEGVENGEYPIVIKATELSGIDGVGSAAEKVVDEIVSILTIVDFVTLDENSTTAPEAYEGNVLVKRSIKKDVWNTICLPFAMTEAQVNAAFGDDVQLGDFTGCTWEENDEGDIVSIKVKFTSASAIEANHPYIIKVSNPISYEDGFKVEGVTVNPDDAEVKMDKKGSKYNTFYGTYVPMTLDTYTLYISNNQFFYSAGSAKLKGYRGYFEFERCVLASYENEYDVKVYVSFDDDKVDAIEDLRFVETNGAVYTIDGKFIGRDVDLKKLQKGIYIIDGKKVAIK